MDPRVQKFLDEATIPKFKNALVKLNLRTSGNKPELKLRFEEGIMQKKLDEILEIISNVPDDPEGDQDSTCTDNPSNVQDNEGSNCSLEEFAIFFLNFVRNQTYSFLKGNIASSCDTPPITSVTASQLNHTFNLNQSTILSSSNSTSILIKKSNPEEEPSTNSTSQHDVEIVIKKSQNIVDNKNQSTKSQSLLSHHSDCELSPLRTLDRNTKFNDSLQFTSTPTKFRKENRKSLNDSLKNEGSFSNQLKLDSPKIKSNVQQQQQQPSSGKKVNRYVTVENLGSNSKGNKNSNEKGKSPGRQTLCLGDFLVSSLESTPIKHKRKPSNESSSNCSTQNVVAKDYKTKPKRRVVPTPVNPSTTATNTFTSPAIRNENNILKIAEDEVHDHDSGAIVKERQLLRNNLTTIVKEFEEETALHQPSSLQSILKEKLSSSIKSENLNRNSISGANNVVDLSTVTNKIILDILIEIHSALIDLYLTTNILGEISYLVHLLNAVDEISFTQMKGITSTSASLSKSTTVTELDGIDDINGRQDNMIQSQIDSCLINRANNELYTVFKKLSNCIYFALGVLTKQKYLLALLDVTTLRVILDNERLVNLNDNLKEFLMKIYTHKIQLETKNSGHEISYRIGSNFTNVSYQQDNDTRNNFPSQKEFVCFNKQRDMFYMILRTWENKHLNHTWNFAMELGPKIKELLQHMEHPINMAHLAKLFTSQLILSSNFTDSSTQSEIELLNIDRNKLNKLHQRLITPSNFSTDYQFPGNQIFFKEFLMMANSIVFLEQVKIALIAELMEMNDSSYEIINLQSKCDIANESRDSVSSSDASGSERKCYNEYVVRPEIISTMRMLAKFLGLVMSRPFIYDECKNAVVDNRQIELRNMLQPTFDVMAILKKAIVEKKLIITLPWVVQYLYMLDYITLRLTYYRQLTQLLYELYISLSIVSNNSNSNDYGNSNSGSTSRNNSSNNNDNKNNASLNNHISELLQMRPTSIFILRLCLSWLFDHYPNMAEDYYSYRKQNRNLIFEFNNDKRIDSTVLMNVVKPMTINNRKIIKDELEFVATTTSTETTTPITMSTSTKKLSNDDDDDGTSNKFLMEQQQQQQQQQLHHHNHQHSLYSYKCEKHLNIESILQEHSFDPLLESILNVACPFLADFRVSIMPTKFSKCPSRTGRYRHITIRTMSSAETRTTSANRNDFNSTTATNKTRSNGNGNGGDSSGSDCNRSDTQTKLFEAFLHSQSLSMRRTVEFLIERITSAVIKDYQMEVLLLSKTEAMNKVIQINSTKRDEIKRQMRSIYSETHKKVMQIWDEKIPQMIEIRVKNSLEGLLPNETMDVVRRTCTTIIIEKCKMKTENWKILNWNGLDFYTKNIESDAEKIFKNNNAILTTRTTTVAASKDGFEIDETKGIIISSENGISKQQNTTTTLTIDITKGYPSKIFDQLQYWLHFSISRPEFIKGNAIEKFCIDFLECLQSQKLPSSVYKISGFMTIGLIQNLLKNHDDILTESLLEKFIDIWLCDRIKNFIRIPEKSESNQSSPSDDNNDSHSSVDENKILVLKNTIKNDNIFDSLITKYFIQSLGKKSSSFERLSQLLIKVVNVNLVTMDYLNEQFVKLFKEDWSQDVFNEISKVLNIVCEKTSNKSTDNDKSQLFMEMLADFSRDVEDF